MKVAQFYDKQKNYRAAVIYYNEVIRQEPGSTESERAKKRIDQLKGKVWRNRASARVCRSRGGKEEKRGRGGRRKSGCTRRGEPSRLLLRPKPPRAHRRRIRRRARRQRKCWGLSLGFLLTLRHPRLIWLCRPLRCHRNAALPPNLRRHRPSRLLRPKPPRHPRHPPRRNRRRCESFFRGSDLLSLSNGLSRAITSGQPRHITSATFTRSPFPLSKTTLSSLVWKCS